MVSTLCVRATYKNQCEDAIFYKETASSIWGCVCDGCSTGIKSHFASQFMCYYTQCSKLRVTTDPFLEQLAKDLDFFEQYLELNEMNFLSTLLLFHYNKENKVLFLRLLGDGYYYINGEEFVLDQENTPDYFAYHLGSIGSYLEKYPEISYGNVESFQICTDGLSSFVRSQFADEPKFNPKELMLSKPMSENHLVRMYNGLKKDNWTLNDDFSIVSYVSQPE